MANPTLSASLDKATYAKGEKMTLTVTYADADNKSLTVTVSVTDSAGNQSDPVTIPVNISDKVTVSVTDTDSRTWTKVSDNGSVAVYTATA